MKTFKPIFLALIALLISAAWAPLAAPSRPALLSPTGNRIVTDPAIGAITFKWGASITADLGGITGYDIEIANNATVDGTGAFLPANIVDSSAGLVGTTYTNAVPLDYAATYYWHVMSHDGSATPDSLWSATGIFRVAVQPPTLTDPLGTWLIPDDSTGNPNLLGLRPTFEWTPGIGAVTSYTLLISTNCSFLTTYRTVTVYPTTNPVTYTPTIDLLPNVKFCWRVRANNATLGSSAWSGGQAFLTAHPPTTPVLTSPTGNAYTTDMTLRWAKSIALGASPFDTYEIEIFDDPNVNSAIPIMTVDDVLEPTLGFNTTTSYLIDPPLASVDTYYWRIRAINLLGEYSAWSAVGTFRVGVEAPIITPFVLVPVPPLDELYPIDSAGDPHLLSLRPLFMWTPGINTEDNYTIQISRNCTFTTIYRTATVYPTAVPPNQYLPTTDLLPNTDFCWRIRANSTLSGASIWVTSALFHTANPPTVPVPLTPANGSTVNDDTPSLTWKISAGANFLTYQIQIFDNPDVNASVPILDVDSGAEPDLGLIATAAYTVTPALSPASTYYWRIRAFNTLGEYSAWSTVFKFTVGIVGQVDSATMNPSEAFGNVPGLDDPANPSTEKFLPVDFTGLSHDNFRLLTLRPKFSWDPSTVPNAQSFNVQVASASSGNCNIAYPELSKFTATLLNATVADDPLLTFYEYVPTGELPPNQVLCWRVRPYHSVYKYGQWSEVQIFLTANPPYAPKPTVASVPPTIDVSPILTWNQVVATRVSDPASATFGKYEVEISTVSNFKGYTYVGNLVPPYDEPVNIADFPLPAPILPGNLVTPHPAIRVDAPDPDCPYYPAIDQAHNAADPSIPGNPANAHYEEANNAYEPWYQLHEEYDSVNPIPEYGPLCGGRTYYWRVRAYNSLGEYSDWSTSSVIPVIVDAPTNLSMGVVDATHIDPTSLLPANIFTAPLPAPATALIPQDLRPVFMWDAVYGTNAYEIVFTLGGRVFYTKALSRTTFQPNFDFPAGATMTWRVYSIDPDYMYLGITRSASSEIVSFTLPRTASAPTFISPGLNQLIYVYTPDMKINKTTMPLGLTFGSYQIQISRDNTFTLVLPDNIDDTWGFVETDTTYTVALADALTPMRTYYWRVRACDASPVPICGAWSTVTSFRTAIEAPINLLSNVIAPALTTRPTFSWDPVLGNTRGYTLYYSLTTSCALPYSGGQTVLGTTFTVPVTAPLYSGGVTYTWCVRANDSLYGPSLWAVDTYLSP